ncbi:sugar transporter [Shimia isoporae]|uniref:sugar transporter n=1 Tax=Shimia isoporae TaxID=647720 RepID=UPI001046B59D|nr:sugar transporter [Shimia isoporae]
MLLVLAFLLWVVAPFSAVVWYLYTIADDQYASYVGFTVRTEEVSSGIEVLGGITELSSGNSSKDSDILYKFISSRQMVEAVDAELGLESIYINPDDPVFGLKEDSTIEDKQDYWKRVVKVYYDTRSELIELRVVAFDAISAQQVAQAIVNESTRIINDLTAIAREDTTRYAREELDRTIARLKEARQAINTFRARTQIVDPLADTQGHLGLLNNLQTQLAAALIELDMVRQTARAGDPRITQGERRVQVIEERIAEERKRFGSESETEDDTYSRLVGEYEELAVELEFANSSYLSALAAYDTALAEAQRKSRYLAAYVNPTLAESAEYPQRVLISALTLGALLLSFLIMTLAYYSLRDRR